MTGRTQDQALALAGVAQFALYAHELAARGRDLPARTNAARRAIFCTDPDAVIDVYGDLAEVGDGISFLKTQLAGTHSEREAAQVARYIGQLLRLAGRLRRNKAAGNELRGIIDRARLAEEAEAETILNEGYQATISHLKPRIMLRGHPSYLENSIIQARARMQLMAAIRCGYLWRQCGGSFPTLFLRRKALLAALRSLGPSTTLH